MLESKNCTMPSNLLRLRSLPPFITIVGFRHFILCPDFDFGQKVSQMISQYLDPFLGYDKEIFCRSLHGRNFRDIRMKESDFVRTIVHICHSVGIECALRSESSIGDRRWISRRRIRKFGDGLFLKLLGE
jgi:hypothetical protein